MLHLLHLLSSLSAWHGRLIDRHWLSVPKGRIYGIACALLVGLAVLASAHMRVWQYGEWQKAGGTTYAGDVTAFSTTDAPYFLLIAKEINDHDSSESYARLRNFPDNLGRNAADRSLRNEPLLSVIISQLAADNSLQSLFAAAHQMLPVTAALTALAVALAFGAAGFWAEGAIAGLGSTLSFAYLSRTAAGRIDTDQLNLFFIYLITALLVWAGRARSLRVALALCLGAGLVTHFFDWWWPKPILNWAFLGGLLWLSFLTHRHWVRPLLLGAVFFVICGRFGLGLSVDVDAFTANIASLGGLRLPHTFNTITELTPLSIGEIFRLLSGNILLAAIALVGLLGWIVVYPGRAFVFLPIFALGMLNFIFGNRVVFFAAPVIWFAIAWLGIALLRFLMGKFPLAIDQKWRHSATAPGAAVLVFAAVYFVSANPVTRPHIPHPSFSPTVIEGFDILGRYVRETMPKRQPVIASWWDYGYAATLFSDIPVIHDGGTQTGPKTHLIARALMSEELGETARILKFIGNEGVDEIAAISTSTAMLDEAFQRGPKAVQSDIYLIVTAKMARWMPSISQLGLWDSEEGKALSIYKGSNELSYRDLQCTGQGAVIDCNGRPVDLNKGTFDGRAVLSGAVQTDNGVIGSEIDFRNPNGFYLQFNQRNGGPWSTQLVHQRLFNSSFNKLFYLGIFDPAYFTPLIDAFPHYRIYQIN